MNEFLSEKFTAELKTLELKEIGSTFRQTLHAEVDDLVGIEYNERAHRLAASVLCEHLADDYYETVTESWWPKTTWQMFKKTHRESWWLRWFVRRYPIKWETDHQKVRIKVERYASYPQADVPIKRLGRPIPFENVKRL